MLEMCPIARMLASNYDGSFESTKIHILLKIKIK